jgi:peptidoglycan/xylan/chitin deacetylase (PgdA/CDA1 family)
MESKIQSLKSLKKVLKMFIPKKRNAAISKFSKHLDTDYGESRIPLLHDFLNWEQIRFMSKTDIWEIGAHTLSHNSLGTLSEADGKREIMGSMLKVSNEVRLSHPPLFSYPEGQEFDLPSYAVKTLQESGLHSAPSAIPGLNEMPFSSSESFFRLRRYMVGFEDLPFPWPS